MKALIQYITDHSHRGPCTCGECSDASSLPQVNQLAERSNGSNGNARHTADLVFFKVTANLANPPNAATLRRLITEAAKDAPITLNFFDGKEHNFFEIGKWIGNQAFGLTLIGLGALLELWTLHTPATLCPGTKFPRATEISLAESGCIAITAD